ncbi:MAG: SPFH domain-containing protein [Defluviitaleaceae bacterium]|nr:SPFH domain-containing protein [Defluviitaleaceae bacterium]
MDNLSFLEIAGIALVAIVVVFFLLGYVKAPPDRAVVISGVKKRPRLLIGTAGFRLPFFERTDSLYLKQVTVPVVSNSIPTNDFINVNIEAVIKIRICSESDTINRAMTNFLNKSPQDIIQDTQDALAGNMREIIGTLTLKDLSQNKDKLSEAIRNAAGDDMRALGLEIVTCNIQNVSDEKGLIEDLGMENTAAIQKDASILKANAERDVAVARAATDKEANDARVKSQMEIAQKNNELAVREAELQKITDTKKAEAEAAFEIQKQEQRKTIEITSTNADIARAEREVELRRKEAEVKEQALEADVKRKAEAERYRQEQEAEANLFMRTKDAEAKKIEFEREAEALKIKAEAERHAQEQEAEAIKAKGRAEADAIQAKGLAEAEAIDKKAEAMKKYGQAAITEMIVGVLPDIARSVAEPISAISDVRIIGGDANGVAGMSDNVPVLMAKTMETVKAATGIDLEEIIRGESFDAKTTRNINFTGIPGEQVEALTEIVNDSVE